ncbi:chorismate mutase [Streptomyces alkaliterrae]|uniref:Chorismate mutase n=1 Tax=Streptomyces alkaliterrae TaxID=2213162 RepID=A0A5P0YU26_9ACTN|nr:chorismate mutase [Streptomyces alkaliterrae]MBB1258802.1 chorismate mutase [Streptomyces alkaliterrae]MQS03814.1 chorismate mutase [Streptomyces alkaliterrae]
MTTTTPTTPTTPTTTPTTTASTATTDASDPEQVIGEARERIDELDARIIRLVRERMEVSSRIQRTRIAAGGRRVHLSREMEVLSRFRAELGGPGTTLAMTLLELSRGRV